MGGIPVAYRHSEMEAQRSIPTRAAPDGLSAVTGRSLARAASWVWSGHIVGQAAWPTMWPLQIQEAARASDRPEMTPVRRSGATGVGIEPCASIPR